MEYIYGVMTTSIPIDPQLADANPNEFSIQVTMELNKFVDSLTTTCNNAPNGPVEALSHSVVRVGHFLLLSALTRRPS